MRTGISFTVSPTDRQRLMTVVKDRNAPQKHVWRAEIVLLSADGVGTVEIMRQTGKSKTCVWRWQERFAAAGVEGLLRDKTRPSRIPPLGPEVVERVVALTLQPIRRARATHWTADMMAQGRRHQRQRGAAHLEGARPAAPPLAAVQALQRSAVRRQAARRRRPLCRSAGPCHRAVGRREEPDPGARPHPAGPAA